MVIIMAEGTVLSIERCSLHDGPGIRTTVFLKGCPLSCLWCHNPESQAFSPELYYFDEKCIRCGICTEICTTHAHSFTSSQHEINRSKCILCEKCVSACPASSLELKGSVMQAQDVIEIVLKDKRHYESSGGGLTLSGGEPLSQFEFSAELLQLAKAQNIHTCVETSGFVPTMRILSIAPFVDLFLYDYKESDAEQFEKTIGVDDELITKNLFTLDKAGSKIILRCPIIPTCNDRDDHFAKIAETANRLENITEINVMPYHPMGQSKSGRIGREYPLAGIDFSSDEKIIEWIEKISRQTKVPVKKG